MALGNAASIIQLIDFGTRVLVGVTEVVRDGIDLPNVDSYRKKRIPSLLERLILLNDAAHPGDPRLRDDIVQSCYKTIVLLDKEIDSIRVLVSDTSFDRAKKAFAASWKQNTIEKLLSEIEHDVTTLLSYLEISNFKNLRIKDERDASNACSGALEKLRHVQEADHKSQTFDPCMDGTRVSILHQLYGWANAADRSPNVYWLNGMAGTGKSAIALSLSRWLESNGLLGGTFFCSRRGSEEQRDVRRILPTLLWNLAQSLPAFASALVDALTVGVITNLATRTLSEQFQALFQESATPVWSVVRRDHRTFVFLVDGMDECDDSDATEQFLDLLLKHAGSMNIKTLVTSRPEPHIAQSFSTHRAIHNSLRLHEVEEDVIQADIRLYLKTRLTSLSLTHQTLQSLEYEWPPDRELSTLIRLAQNLFIYASTSYKYIADRKADPCQRLTRLTSSYHSTGSLMNKPIDGLYATILRAAFEGVEVEESQDISAMLRAIVCIRTPLPVNDLGNLLGFGLRRAQAALLSLHSLIRVPEIHSRSCISTLHASFGDYLTDRSRCGSEKWFVDQVVMHSFLSTRCLYIMVTELKFNISSSSTSYLSNAEMHNRESLASHLIYSCWYWVNHLVCSSAQQGLLDAVRAFFRTKFLFWLEVLSLTEAIENASSWLMRVRKCYVNISDISAYIKDANEFVVAFREPISFSAPHIYISALPFTRSNSLIAQAYRSQFHSTLVIDSRNPVERVWPVIQIDNYGSNVNSVAYSPDGRRIVSCSGDGVIRLWDADTGEEAIMRMKGDASSGESVSFSPNGKQIAFGSRDMTVRVWDVETGEEALKPMIGHSNHVKSVRFSPNGKRIVSGSSDKTIRVWDVETGKAVSKPMEGHTDAVNTVAFSPDGKWIVSGSSDCTIRIWDAESGGEALEPLEGHTAFVHSVAFSPNSKRIVSGSTDQTVQLWDASTGKAVFKAMGGNIGGVQSVGFSPDGKWVVSGSLLDQMIRVWDAETGRAVSVPLAAHEDQIQHVEFSPNGRQIISCSWDGTIRVWDADMNEDEVALEPTGGHTDFVNSVAISPDGKRLVSGSCDRTIRVWDMETGEAVSEAMEGHTGIVHSVAFSPDGKWIVSGSQDTTIRIWDAKTWELYSVMNCHNLAVYFVTFSPNGKHILSACGDEVRLWEVETGEFLLMNGHTKHVHAAACSADGNLIASGSYDNTISLWNAITGEAMLEATKGHTEAVSSVAFSPDSCRIASGSLDQTVRVWDVETGETVLKIEGHLSSVQSVAFSPDGKRIVSGSEDGAIQEWDLEVGNFESYKTIGWHERCVSSVKYSPDGKCIVSGSDDKTIRVWDAGDLRTTDQRQMPSSESPPFTFSPVADHFCANGPHADDINMEDGWIIGPAAELLFWVPLHLRKSLWWPRTKAIIGAQPLEIDLTRFVHGESWAKCRD